MILLFYIKLLFLNFYKSKRYAYIFLIIFNLFHFTKVQAQEHIQLFLNKEKSHSINFNGSAQFWIRHTDMNPGSLVNNRLRSSMTDLSLRRYRLNFNGNADDKIRYVFVLGDNNWNYYTIKNPSIQILDAYIDFQINSHLGIGIGKQGWAGLSRYSAPGATQPLAFDIVFPAVPLVNVYDDILRKWGIYARGEINKLDYRISLTRPKAPTISGLPNFEKAVFSKNRPEFHLSSYFKYQFKDKESQYTAWMPGTYLGKKEIFNIGMGGFYQPKSTWLLSGLDTTHHALKAFSMDLFYEKPLAGNKAITGYFAWFNYDFGRNFIRNIGINNPATGVLPTESLNGPGNNAPVAGTGNTMFFQLGYLFPVNAVKNKHFQPYGSFQYSQFQAFDDAVMMFNTGFNFYLKGQDSKITLGYENRPVFSHEENTCTQSLRKGLWILQYQIRFGR
ncbi:hypothetical protein BH23BAC1_BH23BAC1_28610 [soil metagenome]